MEKAFINASEASRLTGVGAKYVKKLVSTGQWPGKIIYGRKMGKKNDKILIPKAKLLEMMGVEDVTR